ncbi:MAG: hypothetical protein ACI9A2_004408 [Halioglobus sp.]|jgi:hypothetical protein
MALPLVARVAAHLGALNVAFFATAVFFGGSLVGELRFYLERKCGVEELSSNPRILENISPCVPPKCDRNVTIKPIVSSTYTPKVCALLAHFRCTNRYVVAGIHST